MTLYFSALFIIEIALSSLDGLSFILQLALGESMCKQEYNLNYFQILFYMELFQPYSYCT